jgi:hypothetical protein
MFSLLNGIKPAGVEGMTFAKPLEREAKPGKNSFFLQGFLRINGTARAKTTARA